MTQTDPDHDELDVGRLCWILAQDLYQAEKSAQRHGEDGGRGDKISEALSVARRNQIREILQLLDSMGVDVIERAYAHTRGSEFPECDRVRVPSWQDPDDDSLSFQRIERDAWPPIFTVLHGDDLSDTPTND